MNSMIRVLIVSPFPVVCYGLRAMLADSSNIAVVGDAADTAAALSLSTKWRSAVVLLDCQFPGTAARDFVLALHVADPSTRVLAFSAFVDRRSVQEMVQAGVVGYLVKTIAPNELARSVEAVASGETPFSPMAATHVTAMARGEITPSVRLTERELEILGLVVEDNRNSDIGRKLGISDSAVRAYLRSIFDKLGVDSRTGAAVWAMRHGLGQE